VQTGGQGVAACPTSGGLDRPLWTPRHVTPLGLALVGHNHGGTNEAQVCRSRGTFAGDTSGGCGQGTYSCGTNSANAPWGWDDGNDLPARGELASDPAKLATEYFTIPGGVSRDYSYNPYRSEAAPRPVD
jgi:hypothetical protein